MRDLLRATWMYHRLWVLLPGPVPAKAALAVLAVAAVVVLLMGVVFPGVEALLPASGVAFG